MAQSDFEDKMELYRFNPVAIQRSLLENVERTRIEGQRIVDPSNPFVEAMEAVSVVFSAAMMQNEVNTRRLYQSNAQNPEDLYPHMSDVDFANVFAQPASVNINLLLSKSEVVSSAVPIVGSSTRKLTIPRNTEFSVGDIIFTMQHPIDIRVLPHGGILITYDTDRPSPLVSVESNHVDWFVTTLDSHNYIQLTVPVQQMKIKSYYAALESSTGFVKTYSITDKFHYCRVYKKTQQNKWEEIRTTFTEQTYDVQKPTAVLRLIGDQLDVMIPQVYFTNNSIGSSIRVDVYTTKGPLNLSLQNYMPGAFGVRWVDLDEDDQGKFYSPMLSFGNMAVFSADTVMGGKDGLTFEEMRERVLTNSLGSPDLPITMNQLQAVVQDRGFELVKGIDTVTNREFYATRELPIPDNAFSPANGAVLTIESTFEELSARETVIDNGQRLTILPSTIYRSKNGVPSIVLKSEIDALLGLNVEARAGLINNDNLLYSPLHYVLDITNNHFVTRPYQLMNPKILGRFSVDYNESTEVQFNIKETDLIHDPDNPGNFVIRLLTSTDDTIKNLPLGDLNAQLSFIPHGMSQRVYMNAIATRPAGFDDEILFDFIITSDLDITSDNRLRVSSFMFDDTNVKIVETELLRNFDLVLIMDNWEPSELHQTTIDQLISPLGLPAAPVNRIGVSHMRLRVELGQHLEQLWTRSRSVIGPMPYQTYSVNIPALYERDVFQRDGYGNIEWESDGGDGIQAVVLHSIGDPILDPQTGDPVYKHIIGETIMDEYGEPVPVPEAERKILRQTSLMLIDARYYFATTDEAVQYRESLNDIITRWVTRDVYEISRRLLEQTKIYYYPKSMVGSVAVIVGEGSQMTLPADQTLTVTYHLTSSNFSNGELRGVLERDTRETINTELRRQTVSRDNIIAKLKSSAGENIISVDITGLFGDSGYTTATLRDNSTRFVVGTRLFALPDENLGIEDAITVAFVRHTE